MEDSLVATRKRRVNAGLRLKELIQLEEHKESIQLVFPITEDDENVNLLFQEDGDDDEFMVEERSSDEEQGEEDEEEGEQGEGEQPEGDDDETEVVEVNPDEQLSDLDISDSDSDESEGERELQTQEKLKKKRKKAQLIPEIKKRPAPDAPKPSKKFVPALLELLLLELRRSLSRALVVQQKKALVKRLRDDEERRQTMAPVVRPQYREMTQEERLEEAVETERRNVLALHAFREQEIVKKEQRRLAMHLKRPPMVDVVRLESKETFVTPLDEVKLWRKLYVMMEKFKRKPTRKKPIQQYVELFVVKPGELQRDLPFFEPREGDPEIEGEGQASRDPSVTPEGGALGTSEKLQSVEVTETKAASKTLPEAAELKTEAEEATNGSVDANGEMTKTPEADKPNETNEAKEDGGAEESNGAKKDEAAEPNEANEPATKDQSNEPEANEATPDATVKQEPTDAMDEDTATPVKEEKKVTFAEEYPEEEEEEKPPVLEWEYVELDRGELFQGPVQRVGKQTVFLFDFEDPRYLEALVKSYVLGPQAVLPASHRFKDVKTIFRLGNRDNPYATIVKKLEDPLFELVTKLTDEDPVFDRLHKLPRLGVRLEIIDDSDDDSGDTGASIRIETEAPLGLYLPNNNKKTCLLSGREVRYFDPQLGVAYATMDDFALLKEIEQGKVPWFSFAVGTNDTGPIDLYLGHRDKARHAAGVPEGFA